MKYIKTFETIYTSSIGSPDLIIAVKSGNLTNVKKLLNANLDVNCKDHMGWTPLLWATFNRNIKMIKLLIDSGADMNYKATWSLGGTKRILDFYDLSVDKGYIELSRWIETYYPEFVAPKKYNL